MGGERDSDGGRANSLLKRSRVARGAGRSLRQQCHFFDTAQGCRHGEKCTFLHSQPNSSADRGESAAVPSFSSQYRTPPPHFNDRQFRQLCRFLALPQGCRNGDTCPFSHSTASSSSGRSGGSAAPTSPSLSSACSAPPRQPLPPFSYLIQHGDRIRNQHDKRRLVLSALQEKDVDAVLLAWTDQQYPERLALLRTLLQETYVIDAGWRATSISFQRVLVPLITLLASDRMANTAHASRWKQMLSVVSGQVQHFIPRAIDCIEHLTTDGQLEIERRIEVTEGSDVAYVVTRWEEVVLPFVDLLYCLSSQATDFAAEHAERLVEWCQRLDAVVQRCSGSSAVGTRKANTAMARIRTIIDNTLAVEWKMQQLSVRRNERKERDRWLTAIPALPAPAARAFEMPGELRAGGVRHDNDRTDFRHIGILPTQQETMCTLPPFLPCWPPDLQVLSGYAPNPTDAYLDAQFRLLRHDALGEVQLAVRCFIQQGLLSSVSIDTNRVRCVPKQQAGLQGSSAITLQLYRQLSVVSLQPRLRRGVCCEIEFDQPTEYRRLERKQDRAAYWESGLGSKTLQHGTLVALLLNAERVSAPLAQPKQKQKRKKNQRRTVEDAGAEEREEKDVGDTCMGPTQYDRLAFGVVERAGGASAVMDKADRCRVLIVMLPGHGDWQALTGYSVQTQDRAPRKTDSNGMPVVTESVMLEVRGHFFAAYQSVLSGLQHISAGSPVLQLLVNDLRVPPSQAPNSRWLHDRPPYLPDGFVFDLSFLLRERKPPLPPLRVTATSYATVKAALDAREGELLLDDTQIDAFAAGLMRQVSVIQGPPGTGQSIERCRRRCEALCLYSH